MNITKNFSLEELTKSSTATARHIDNTPSEQIKANLKDLCENMLQPIRDYYGLAIKVSSGYRCPKLNKSIGGATNSSHMYGFAADIKPANGDMKTMQAKILEWAKSHAYDQIIIEQPTNGIAQWIHVGWKRGSNNSQRKQILKAVKVNGKWNYTLYKAQ